MVQAITRINLLILAAAASFAQPSKFITPATGQATESLTFEVASVKPSATVLPGSRVFFGPPRGGPGTPDPGQITWTHATLKSLLMAAYDVKAFQVSGPDWLDTERFDIAAKVPVGATNEQVNVMYQNLLAERFGVMLHRESKEFQVDDLVIARGGPKLKESAEDPAAPLPPPGPPTFDKGGELSGPGFVTMIMMGSNGPSARTVSKAQPLSKLTTMLGNQIGRPVLDKTGLTGKYDFTLEFTPDLKGVAFPIPPPGQPGTEPTAAGPADNASAPGPDLAAAVQRQLGMRLVASKAKLDVVVIDKAAKVPTEN
jgi:uncharacterized protein (TIGR03435 family)